jgi:DNA-binding PadR family transcriptional regulator
MKGVTAYQLEILVLVNQGGPDGALDLDQMLTRLSWAPTKESAQFPVRALVKKGLLKKSEELLFRRGRRRASYSLTPEGLQLLDPRLTPLTTKTTSPPIPGLPEPELDVALSSEVTDEPLFLEDSDLEWGVFDEPELSV